MSSFMRITRTAGTSTSFDAAEEDLMRKSTVSEEMLSSNKILHDNRCFTVFLGGSQCRDSFTDSFIDKSRAPSAIWSVLAYLWHIFPRMAKLEKRGHVKGLRLPSLQKPGPWTHCSRAVW